MKLKLKKPLVIFTILTIVICTIGVCYFYTREDDLFTEEQIELTNSKYQEDESLIDDGSTDEEENEEEQIEENIIENEETTNNSNEIESDSNNNLSSTNSSNNTSSNSTVNSSSDSTTSSNNDQTNTNNSITEDDNESNSEVIEENDTEYIDDSDDDYESRYNEALKEVEYATHAECLAAAFTIGIADTVNIYGIDCIELNFEGVSIGYKIYIHYSNPLE